jgi:glycosyltransferase involved in cell wall biosynthesis
MADPENPRVSVVMAAFNRSDIIGFAIQSVRNSTVTDWELIVVGDACTDDTQAVVEAFADPRIRFMNLPENCGEQSGPNNKGAMLARGRYLAFLNQDDLWTAHHLQNALDALESDASLDLVFDTGLFYRTDNHPAIFAGAKSLDGLYHPTIVIPASLWVMRRATFDRIGPWRSAKTIARIPSQDWLLRCRAAGAKIRALPHLGAVLVPSGTRKNSYGGAPSPLHKIAGAHIADSDWLCSEMLRTSLQWEDKRTRLAWFPFLLESGVLFVRKILNTMGLFPTSPIFWLRFWRKGSYIRHLRKSRGLTNVISVSPERTKS